MSYCNWLTRTVIALLCVDLAACTLPIADFVSADEISGAVVDARTGEPISDAIVAIRFERNNTGHSGPHCFRSMAAKTDEKGIFKFSPWRQQNTLANYAVGELTVYKAGYLGPQTGVYLRQSNRSIGNIPLGNTIKFPKSETRITISRYTSVPSPQDRMFEIQRVVANFTCRWQAEFDDAILLYAVRNEIASAPYADEKYTPQGFALRTLSPTHLEWIESIILSEGKHNEKPKP